MKLVSINSVQLVTKTTFGIDMMVVMPLKMLLEQLVNCCQEAIGGCPDFLIILLSLKLTFKPQQTFFLMK